MEYFMIMHGGNLGQRNKEKYKDERKRRKEIWRKSED